MANINVRKQQPEQRAQLASPVQGEWDPARWMSRLLAWDPFREMTPFAGDERFAFAPAFEVKETKDAYVFKADVPGIKQEDLEIQLSGNRLTISGKREEEQKTERETYYAYERSYGTFNRSFTLPEGIDANKVAAELHDGVLTVSVAKSGETMPKKIAVSTAQSPKS